MCRFPPRVSAVNAADPSAVKPPPPPLGVFFVQAVRANWGPAVVLFLFALAILLGYAFIPAVHDALEYVSGWKQQYGYLYAAISTAIFIGVIPLLIDQLKPRDHEPLTWASFAFFTLFWLVKGVEVDALYRLQAHVFGHNASLGVVVCKVLVDQLIYVPLYAIPMLVFFYQWEESGFRWRRVWAYIDRTWYRRKVAPTQITNWIIWVPAVPLIYLLPTPLQLPLQNIVGCFFALLMLFITRHTR